MAWSTSSDPWDEGKTLERFNDRGAADRSGAVVGDEAFRQGILSRRDRRDSRHGGRERERIAGDHVWGEQTRRRIAPGKNRGALHFGRGSGGGVSDRQA